MHPWRLTSVTRPALTTAGHGRVDELGLVLRADAAGHGREHVIGTAADQADGADHKHQDYSQHHSILGDILALVASPQVSDYEFHSFLLEVVPRFFGFTGMLSAQPDHTNKTPPPSLEGRPGETRRTRGIH